MSDELPNPVALTANTPPARTLDTHPEELPNQTPTHHDPITHSQAHSHNLARVNSDPTRSRQARHVQRTHLPPEEAQRLANLRTVRDSLIWNLKLQGLDNTQIQERVERAGYGNIATATVEQIIQKKLKHLSVTDPEAVLRLKNVHHARAEYLYQQAVEAWQNSIGPRRQTTTVTGRAHVDRNGDTTVLPDQITIVEDNSPGNPAFLTAAQQHLNYQADLHGLKAPKRTDVTSDGQAVKAYIGLDLDEI